MRPPDLARLVPADHPLRRHFRRPASALRAFLDTGSAGGVILMGAALLAIVIANSPLAPAYFGALKTYLGPLSLLHWINDALMSLFFLLVGLEIKREFLDGQLRTWPDRALPGIAALGGMAVPAIIYVAINSGSPSTLRGWAIPSATDIAFALGVIRLLGARVPISLAIFLTALAILDDLGAVVIIAVFYTETLNVYALLAAVFVVSLLRTLNTSDCRTLVPYLGLGAVLWVFVLLSGVHATVAGVVLALTIPLRQSPGRPDDATSPLHRLEHALHPWCAFVVLPIFGFANAGVSLAGLSWATMLHPVTLGIALGLFVGKQIGVFGAVYLAVRIGLAQLPPHATWLQTYGVATLCGIGFTMSLFIGLLAFDNQPQIEANVKVGVLVGSLMSVFVGVVVLLGRRRIATWEPGQN
ncbi:Na+/H+ antiporter NhaA [Enterovirga rhinocerotis]|uniref:Na(+)/H(+) antiporter NhaA n=1 Tax=Enterovirga rhinocerotis TaxID=1339210 RepID=A0A4R7CB59_9HYPH|nr:Na+/H+ antiporter NhaA [Enterovirga rhinocerotis]TDR95648.1 sodium/proton antiporter (NhaA family) [Enterovirga rhinocerotis]